MALFESLVQRDTRANQPAANTVSIGTLYFVTDELVTERSNGTSWDDYSDAGSAGITALTGDVTASGPGSAAATIANNAVTDAKFRQSAAVSVVGRSANSSGNVADIAAGANDRVLSRIANALGFTQLTIGMFVDAVITYAKLQDVSATSRILSRRTAGSGVIEESTLSQILDFIGSAAQGDILYRDAAAWARLGAGTAGYLLKTGGAAANPSWANPVNALTRTIGITIDGGGSVITTGVKGFIRIPVTGTLTGWTILADVSGAIKIDVWKDVFANYPPTDADSITNGHEPEIAASGTNAEDTNISDWTSVAVTAGDVIGFNVDSVTSIKRAILELNFLVTY